MLHIHPGLENYRGLAGSHILWGMLACAMFIFMCTIFRRLILLTSGQQDPRFKDFGNRLTGLVIDVFLQRRQLRYPMTGVAHILIFWGFIILGVRSINLFMDGLYPETVSPLLHGTIGVIYESLRDIFELLVLGACVFAVWYRAIRKPKRYQGSHSFEAYLVLGMISFLMLTDMLFEGSAMLLGHEISGIFPAAWLFASLLSLLPFSALQYIYLSAYWLHVLTLLIFLNLLPFSKHFHIITAFPNVFFRKLNKGELKPISWENPDIEATDVAGIGKIEDLTWKQILDLYSCTECGRCTDNCPANFVGRLLSPKLVTMKLRDHGYQKVPVWRRASKSGNEASSIVGNVIDTEEIWACTTCGACEQECPVFIEHVDKIVEMRRHSVLMKAQFPPEIEPMFRNLEIYGDPWGKGTARRMEWAEGLNIKTISEEESTDVLFWVGCSGAFDDRYKEVVRSLVRVMKKAEVDFCTLGGKELCCGDFARRTGNEYLYQKLAKKNIETFRTYGIKKVVTSCPHCYNTFKNEYERFGGEFKVLHHTEYIYELLQAGRLKPQKSLDIEVVYHDSCYLGRYNKNYDLPREVLGKIDGVKLVEAERSRDKGFCCGAGGGYMWLVEQGQRVHDVRTEELLQLKPDMVATACPYCLYMLNDGLENQAVEGKNVKLLDLAEIVEQSL